MKRIELWIMLKDWLKKLKCTHSHQFKHIRFDDELVFEFRRIQYKDHYIAYIDNNTISIPTHSYKQYTILYASDPKFLIKLRRILCNKIQKVNKSLSNLR